MKEQTMEAEQEAEKQIRQLQHDRDGQMRRAGLNPSDAGREDRENRINERIEEEVQHVGYVILKVFYMVLGIECLFEQADGATRL